MLIFLFYYVQSLEIMRPILLEHRQIDLSFYQRMKYHPKFKTYTTPGVKLDDDIQFEKPGMLVFNFEMVEGIDYALLYNIGTLNANHILCFGIGSQGFISSEILGLEKGNYILGYCTDGTNSTKYPDMYTSYREFDDLNEDAELDEIDYNYGEQSKGNLFPDKFYLVLRDNELVFMEDDRVFFLFENVDRRRTYVPVITMHNRNQVKTTKRVKKCIVVEEDIQFVQLSWNPFKQPSQKKQKQQQETELAKMLKEQQQGEEDAQIKEDNSESAENQNAGKTDEKEKEKEKKEEEKKKEEEHKEDSEQVKEFKKQEETKELHDQQLEPEDKGEDQGEASPEEIQIEQQEQLNQQDDVKDEELQDVKKGEEKIEGEEEQVIVVEPKPEDDTTETHFSLINIQTHIIEPQIYSQKLISLRPSLIVEQDFTALQDNTVLPDILQDYKSCTYAYLAVKPAKRFFVEAVINNLDDLYGTYPVGIGVYAYQMLDRLRGWRNSEDQLWCLDRDSEDLWQYGALYRSDGTFIDSYIMGEYFKYKVDKESQRQQIIKYYFTDNNRVAFQFGDSKNLILTCINPKFKLFVPIIELKAFKGVPSITLQEYKEDFELPFKYSDHPDKIFESFNEIEFQQLFKFITEKRGSFNEDDDDYVLSGNGGETTSMNMWNVRLFSKQYEWWVKIDELSDSDDIQICIGINQMSSEQLLEKIFSKSYRAQVAYLCDKNDLIHTFFNECPVGENLITFVSGTVLRLRLSNYLLEINDGYQTVILSIRKEGETGMVPSIAMRANSTNKVSFLLEPEKFGPNPLEQHLDMEDIKFQSHSSYDIFTLPIVEDSKGGLFKFQTDKPLLEDKGRKLKENPKHRPIGKNFRPLDQEADEDEEAQKQQQNSERDQQNQPKEKSDVDGDILEKKCIIVFEHCNFEGENKELYPNKPDNGLPPEQFRSIELCKKTPSMTIIVDGLIKEMLHVSSDIECLPSPMYINNIIVQ